MGIIITKGEKMLSNIHTHTTFCDGKNTAEEMVLSAIEKGFLSLGFSGHGFEDCQRYCMTDINGYCAEINRLKVKYADKLQIYLGIEEDAFGDVYKSGYDYVIGSSHYLKVNGKYYSIDASPLKHKENLQLFDNNPVALAENYYSSFCEYLLRRKPDVIGHFDLITKFDELDNSVFLQNPEYNKVAEKYLKEALKVGSIFEVNTGAIGRGYRKTPYPYENLLYLIKKNDGKITITSDSHHISTLDTAFAQTKQMLKDIGFEYVYVLYDNEFKKDYI